MPNYLQKLAAELTGAGLELPMPVASYFAGKTCPFALDTRERLPDWAETHGYSEEQHKKLAKLIGLIASRDAYHQSVVVGGNRVDLDGADTGPVSEFDKESAVRARAAIAAAKQKPRPQAAGKAGTSAHKAEQYARGCRLGACQGHARTACLAREIKAAGEGDVEFRRRDDHAVAPNTIRTANANAAFREAAGHTERSTAAARLPADHRHPRSRRARRRAVPQVIDYTLMDVIPRQP